MDGLFWNRLYLDIEMKYCIFFLCLFLTACSEKMVEFIPIERQGDAYVEMKAYQDSAFVKGLEQVFNYYDVSYEKQAEHTILIEASLYEDKDLMHNYTKKARDKEWLETHPLE